MRLMKRPLVKMRYLIALLLVVCMVNCIGASYFEPLKVMCEINGFRVAAIVDTGAEVSVMSTSCAKRCHLLNQIDTKHSARAVGVGSGASEIVGGIERLPIRMGSLNFLGKLSVLRNSRCDLLIGLDVLRRFNSEVSLRDNSLTMYLRGQRVSIPFLDQMGNMPPPTRHRMPSVSAFDEDEADEEEEMASTRTSRSLQLQGGESDDNEYNFDEEEEECIEDDRVSMEGV